MAQNQSINEPFLKRFIRKTPTIAGILSIYIVVITFIFSVIPYEIRRRIEGDFFGWISDNPIPSLLITLSLTLIMVIGFFLYARMMINKEENNFLAVDEEKSKNNQKIIEAKVIESDEIIDMGYYDNFELYFYKIIRDLDKQIISCDKKASLLLQSGKKYIINGIGIYICFIVMWQALFYISGFDIKYIYGVVASSSLFLFIEFFGAWFLRQYKNFVDTSTYLIKIKSILQRYILAYLALKDGKDKGFDPASVVSMLQEEIKWPETYLLKKPDVNFAKECLETTTNLIKSLQINNKNQDEK